MSAPIRPVRMVAQGAVFDALLSGLPHMRIVHERPIH